jgi:hypothetical protein
MRHKSLERVEKATRHSFFAEQFVPSRVNHEIVGPRSGRHGSECVRVTHQHVSAIYA